MCSLTDHDYCFTSMATCDLHIVDKKLFAAKIDFLWKGPFVILTVLKWM